MMKKLQNIKWMNYLNYIIIGAFTVIMSVLASIGALQNSTLKLFGEISIEIILAVSLSVVVGFLGELSLGHAGFMAVGAYMGGLVASLLDKSVEDGTNILVFLLSLVIGAVSAGIFGFIIGLPALRLRGDYLAIVTLASGEIVKNVFQEVFEYGKLTTKNFMFRQEQTFLLPILGFILVLIMLFVVQNLMKSKHGRAITAIRDNEIAARATGINITKYKLIAFVVSAAFAGVAGVLFSFFNSPLEISKFGYSRSIDILVIVVLGGMGNINGSIVAAVVLKILNNTLDTMFEDNVIIAVKNIVYAIILIIVVIYNNAPGLKSVREKYNLKNLWNKIFKPKHDPANIKNDAARWDVVPTKIEMNEVLSTDIKVVESTRKADKGDKE